MGKKKKKTSKQKPEVEEVNGHAMDHIIIKMSNGKAKKEIINTRG